jgi:multidrug resistance efflux pump
VDEAVCEGHVDSPSGVTALYPTQPGRVVRVEVAENEHVEAGAPVLRVDDRQARLRQEEAAALLEVAQTQLELARTLKGSYGHKVRQQEAAVRAAEEGRVAAEREWGHLQRQARKELVSPGLVDAAEARFRQAGAVAQAEGAKLAELRSHNRDADLATDQARAAVAAARARWRQAEQAVDECTLRAPRAGTVLRVQTGVGDLVAVPPLKPAVLFCPDGALIVRAEVAQEFARGVKDGLNAEIRDDAGPDQKIWQGKVTRVSRWFARQRSVLLEPGQLNDVRTLECIIALGQGGGADPGLLRIGQRVHVTIHKEEGGR